MEQAKNPKETLSIVETARVFGVSRMTIYRMIGSGKLPAIQVGRFARIAKIDLLAYRKNNPYRRQKRVVKT